MRIVSATKTHVRSQGRLLCLGQVETVNVTRGCAGQCVFCYARCYRGAPPAGQLLLYEDLAAQLRRDLAAPRRRRPLADFVIFGSAGDPFLGGPKVAAVALECLRELFAHDVGVSISTRGDIPDEVVTLLAAYRQRVRITIPISSMSIDYTSQWEPGAALPETRLFLAQKLRRQGIDPELRIDPVIPFVTDSTESMRDLLSALVSVGVRRAMVSFVQLRRGVAEQLQAEAPPEALRLVLGCFPSLQDTGKPAEFDHVEPRQAMAGLKRMQTLGKERGIDLAACRCHNPGLPAEHCAIAPPTTRPPPPQAELFGPPEP